MTDDAPDSPDENDRDEAGDDPERRSGESPAVDADQPGGGEPDPIDPYGVDPDDADEFVPADERDAGGDGAAEDAVGEDADDAPAESADEIRTGTTDDSATGAADDSATETTDDSATGAADDGAAAAAPSSAGGSRSGGDASPPDREPQGAESAESAASEAEREHAPDQPDPQTAGPQAPGPQGAGPRSHLPEDVRKYERFKKMDGAQYDRVNEFLRDRTYITAREWAIARLCADFRTETGVEMTKIGEHLPELVPFMTDTYTPQAVNQARASFKEKVRDSGATFLYGAMSGFFTAEELDDVMYEVTEVAKFLLEVEGVDLSVEEELEAEDRISGVMREVRAASEQLRHDELFCPECGHEMASRESTDEDEVDDDETFDATAYVAEEDVADSRFAVESDAEREDEEREDESATIDDFNSNVDEESEDDADAPEADF